LNCSQARELLSTYRELKNHQLDTTELDVHLAQCSSCRGLLEQYDFVSERLRSLPPVMPSTDSHAKLMRALASEHARHLHQASSSDHTKPVPDFLRPYIREHAHLSPNTDALTAFSSAETGPLPIVSALHKRRRPFYMNHLAIVGVAAAFLIVLMMGGLTSLLLLAKNSQSITVSGKSNLSITQQSQVAQVRYTTSTLYPHVDSAIANRDAIYYTAHDDNNTGWMLQRLDNQTKVSTPLLSTPSSGPLIVLANTQSWLVWLQFDLPKSVVVKKSAHHETSEVVRPWTLYALPQNIDLATYTPGAIMPTVLQQGTFNQSTAPAWVHAPIQGVSTARDSLQVALVDAKGHAFLQDYQLGQPGTAIATTTLATTSNGHIFTSPTATSDGTSIYWSEEWLTSDNVLHSDIWTQQTAQASPQPGKWIPHTVTNKYLFLADGVSFQPKIVGNILFLLSTNPPNTTSNNNSNTSVSATPSAVATPLISAAATATATTATINTSSTTTTPRTDASAIMSQPDATVQGTLLAYPVNGNTPLQLPLGADGPVSALQGGGRFIIWQNSDNNFDMYDVVAKTSVSLDASMTAKNLSFLTVSNDTAVWLVNGSNSNASGQQTQSIQAPATVAFNTFSWPSKAPIAR
jgi:hypothetical protein